MSRANRTRPATESSPPPDVEEVDSSRDYTVIQNLRTQEYIKACRLHGIEPDLPVYRMRGDEGGSL
jgi:hypothetical protein